MAEKTRIDELKQKLFDIDLEIVRLIERRARAAQDIGKLRSASARYAPVVDASHLAALEKAVGEPLQPSTLRPVFNAIDAACRLFEVAPRVVFVGGDGGFGWMAAHSYFGMSAELVRADTPALAIEEVSRSRADFAIVPYESLEDGPLLPTIQSIAAADLKLVGERQLVQALTLMNVTGNPADVERIYVAPHDHVACVHYLEANHPRALVLDVRSPVMAWELASESKSSAAIVPRGSIGARDLRVARESVADAGDQRIRYGVISRLPTPRSGADATALLFSTRDQPGALHDILQHFKEKSCNLRRIQSRPLQGEGWEYVFYVEVSGHVTDRNLVAALEGVKRQAKTLKIIGSFPLEFVEPTAETPAR